MKTRYGVGLAVAAALFVGLVEDAPAAITDEPLSTLAVPTIFGVSLGILFIAAVIALMSWRERREQKRWDDFMRDIDDWGAQ